MWKKQGSWNFFHAKLIPNSSIYMLSAKVREVVCEMIGAFIRIYFTFYFFILAFYSKVTSQKIVLIVGF